jgi:23S rRNA (adenine2503-C2)-methyltransferase
LNKIELKGMTREELARDLAVLREPAYRADQILEWIYKKSAASFDEMTNLSADLREKLARRFELNAVHALKTKHAGDTTEKFLFELHDHSLIETVLIPATPGLTSRSDRHTVCVSTQVGCAYGCRFCASGLEGFKRNLTAAEIVDQVLHVRALSGQRVTNLVIMGMGEPMANYDNLLKALKILNSSWSLGIGARKITVSTSGLAPTIRKLANEPMQLRLAVSLHDGATDQVREKIMPVNRKYPIHELMEACDYYCNTKKRMMTFEFILIEGLNDAPEQAEKLAALSKRLKSRVKVNLIPYNPVAGLAWKRPSPDKCEAFRAVLKRHGVLATLRTEKGTDINAACGQLRLQTERDS